MNNILGGAVKVITRCPIICDRSLVGHRMVYYTRCTLCWPRKLIYSTRNIINHPESLIFCENHKGSRKKMSYHLLLLIGWSQKSILFATSLLLVIENTLICDKLYN